MILNLIYVYVINYVVIGMDFFLLTFHLFDKTLQQIGMLDPDAMDTKGIPLTCRYNTRSSRQPIFDPLELSSSLDQTRGSNFSFYIWQQLAGIVMRSFVLFTTDSNTTSCPPFDWNQGDSCMLVPGVKQEDLAKMFPKGVKIHQVPSSYNNSTEVDPN